VRLAFDLPMLRKEKKDNQLVLNHDQRGELFRVAVSLNQSGLLDYSPINIGEIQKEDVKNWREIERLMRSQTQTTARPEKGISRSFFVPTANRTPLRSIFALLGQAVFSLKAVKIVLSSLPTMRKSCPVRWRE
jgi:hypothetical protein